jgi:hypothetical protein
MTAEEDIASVAGQLADLTRTVEKMQRELDEVRQRAVASRIARTSSKTASSWRPKNSPM